MQTSIDQCYLHKGKIHSTQPISTSPNDLTFFPILPSQLTTTSFLILPILPIPPCIFPMPIASHVHLLPPSIPTHTSTPSTTYTVHSQHTPSYHPSHPSHSISIQSYSFISYPTNTPILPTPPPLPTQVNPHLSHSFSMNLQPHPIPQSSSHDFQPTFVHFDPTPISILPHPTLILSPNSPYHNNSYTLTLQFLPIPIHSLTSTAILSTNSTPTHIPIPSPLPRKVPALCKCLRKVPALQEAPRKSRELP